ncbi:putative F-box/LRR-repeat protein 23 [Oryza brachyantha]|uniref:putative F-box/LRR-repeat protein 23 n=1 Tax=Oryza brachyantha TaxID=4533 RepID=UPI001ADB30D4|nr:putative F-box/LRR-repeat protein 23 [Oryza brachyantha]
MAPPPAPPPPQPEWAELPVDAILAVFERLGAAEVLMGAGVVCRTWLRVATREPRLWRRVDLTGSFDPTVDMEAMARAAVDRADGRLEHFAADSFVTDALLSYIAKRTTCMKSLRLLDCMEIADKGLVAVGKTSPCLEELELTTCSIDILLKVVGQAFPNLKCLWLNNRWFDIQLDEFRDNFHALGIACSMPKLRHLQLFANRLRNNALAAILDNCLHLESLDLRQCFNVYVDAELQAKCVRLKDVRFPNDSTKDYEYETYIETPSLHHSLGIPFGHRVTRVWSYNG